MAELFAEFPFLSNDKVVIRKMEEADIPALAEISRNDNVYKFQWPYVIGM